MFRKSMSILCVCCGILILAGCATVGSDFPTDPVRSIELGSTTKADIARAFGQPWRTGIESGDESWTYGYYKYRLFSESETRDLKIIFGSNGTVQSYSFSESAPKDTP